MTPRLQVAKLRLLEATRYQCSRISEPVLIVSKRSCLIMGRQRERGPGAHHGIS